MSEPDQPPSKTLVEAIDQAKEVYLKSLRDAWNKTYEHMQELNEKLADQTKGASRTDGLSEVIEAFRRAEQAYHAASASVARAPHDDDAHKTYHVAQQELMNARAALGDAQRELARRDEAAMREHATAMRDASERARREYEAAYRRNLAAQKQAWSEHDVDALTPCELFELAHVLSEVSSHAAATITIPPSVPYRRG